MKTNLKAVSRALVAAVLVASTALAGCASVADESFLHAGNDYVAGDKMEGA